MLIFNCNEEKMKRSRMEFSGTNTAPFLSEPAPPFCPSRVDPTPVWAEPAHSPARVGPPHAEMAHLPTRAERTCLPAWTERTLLSEHGPIHWQLWTGAKLWGVQTPLTLLIYVPDSIICNIHYTQHLILYTLLHLAHCNIHSTTHSPPQPKLHYTNPFKLCNTQPYAT